MFWPDTQVPDCFCMRPDTREEGNQRPLYSSGNRAIVTERWQHFVSISASSVVSCEYPRPDFLHDLRERETDRQTDRQGDEEREERANSDLPAHKAIGKNGAIQYQL